MPLIDTSGEALTDGWRTLADDEAVPGDDSPIVVSFDRWFAEQETLSRRNAPLGLSITNTQPVERLNGDVNRFDLIALNFPKFSDGRAYSQARILRERLGYRGALRATGNVLLDQLLFMLRSGFDQFDTSKPVSVEAFRRNVGRFTAFYQPAADGAEPVFRRRLHGAGA